MFYAAYVYFEKLRNKQGKPKPEKRETNEVKWTGHVFGMGYPLKPGVPSCSVEVCSF